MTNKIKVITFGGDTSDEQIKILMDEQLLLINNEFGTVTNVSDILNDSLYIYVVMITYTVA